MSLQPYPMLIECTLQVRIWGGRQLESRLGKELPSEQPFGESWEIFWKNRVVNGTQSGKKLGEVIAEYPALMVGDLGGGAEFPLLVKFLDAQDWLSVQVHPNDAKAAELEGEPRGKTECWYVIEADPGAKLAFGLSKQLDAASLREAIDTGHTKEVMQYVEVEPGDFIYVPAGTMHALGPGILIYELQQTSDTTYRVYDWDRMGLDGKPRELHLDKALTCTEFDVNPPAKTPQHPHQIAEGITATQLANTEYFSLLKLALENEYQTSTINDGKSLPYLLTAITGHVEIRPASGAPILVAQGASLFLPAGLGDYRLIPDGSAEVLIAWASVQ